MIKFCYNVIFNTGFLLSAPYYFWKMRRRGNWREGFAERFGKYDGHLKNAITNRHVAWIHAVSVGEVNIAAHLVKALERRAPNLKFVVSTTTSTGMGELKKKLPQHVHKIYYPIDRKKFVSRALRVMRPEAIILVEAEIWPNFLWSARSRGIPTFLVNTRLSEKSFRGYKRFRFIFAPIFRAFRGVGVQNEEDARRAIALGCRREAVQVVGNLKFDSAPVADKPLVNIWGLLGQLGVREGDPIIVAGSTHDGEEAILGRIASRLRQKFPDLFLIAVPRHFERGKQAGEDLKSSGNHFIYRTELSADARFPRGQVNALLVNTTGELRYFYETATVIFVGKSLTAEGGQNPIEPAALGKPIVFGPNMQNFESVAHAFVSNGGAIQVKDEAELETALRDLLQNAAKRAEMGRTALRVVRENQGSIDRTVNMIVEELEDEDIYIRPGPENGAARG